MTQNFSSLVPRQKWFFKQRNMRVGDVVLVQYVGKSKPGSYRLGIVTEVEVDSDGCVRTVTVQYSLLSELPDEERLKYKGITKKTIRASVQRLVLILPVEERLQDAIQNSSPGVQAGTVPDEGLEGMDEDHRTVSTYDVVWDSSNMVYVHAHAQSVAAQHVAGQVGQQAEGVEGDHGRRVDDQAEDAVEDAHEQADEAVGSVEGHHQGITDLEEDDMKKFSRLFRENLKSCAIVNTKFEFEDYEGMIYSQFSSDFNWSAVDEELECIDD